MVAATFYILYAGIARVFNVWLWISIALLVCETLVLVFNKWVCPFTPMAMRYTSDRDDNFDIYLPKVVAKYNKKFFGTIFVIGLLLVIVNLLYVWVGN
ncbi:MAG: hypothetical protein LiPW41_547 [Parcubacteria group bacterium LiPW_41]|nr:MAG: hypothetical protein LiPW41_547 [Parcubacteria group bacterium LiPW_41]